MNSVQEKIVSLYEKGFSGPEIAGMLKKSNSAVYKTLWANGVKMRKVKNSRPDISVKTVERLYDRGLSFHSISRALGCSVTCAVSRYKETGKKPRPARLQINRGI